MVFIITQKSQTLKGSWLQKSTKKKILRRQKEEGDYWDKYKNFSLDSSSEKLDDNKFGLDQAAFDEEKEKVREKNKKKEDICKSLGDDERGI